MHTPRANMTTLIVLPSYNERLNIIELTEAILDVDVGNEVCIVRCGLIGAAAGSVMNACLGQREAYFPNGT